MSRSASRVLIALDIIVGGSCADQKEVLHDNIECRRFGGGLRIGEMESSALAAHGSSRVLQERFRELSDAFEIYTCVTCQLLCDDVCVDIDYAFCRRCQSSESVRSVLVPFTFLVLMTELVSTGIGTKLQVES